MTVTEALAGAAARLAGAGIEAAAEDAERLLRHVLAWDRATVIARAREEVPADAERPFADLVAARAARRPLQHLVGRQAFWRHEFLVGPDVLIPRPETEILVETALALLAGIEAPRIADVGTGSGCVALSLAAERPRSTVVGTDLSAAALAMAARNAAWLGLAGRVAWARSDLLDAFSDRSLDVVASNPPYVTEEEWAGLAPEVRDHDPRMALVPPEGVGGLYPRLLEGAARVLRPGGAIAVEMGAGQAEEIAALARGAGLEVLRVVPDLRAVPRVVVARRPTRVSAVTAPADIAAAASPRGRVRH